MEIFRIKMTGDLSNEGGQPVADLALDIFDRAPFVNLGFLRDQGPVADGHGQERLYSMELMPHHVASADAIVVSRPWVKGSAFSAGADKLVAIARAGIGYDKIDLGACTANDVVVYNSPHGMTHSTAAAAMLLILGLSKRLPMQQKIIREHRWGIQREAVGEDLEGMTLGIIGLGRTGSELVRLIAPFGMRVIAYSPRADPQEARALGVTLVGSLGRLLGESDYVTLHCRLDEHTRGLIGEAEIAHMKPTAYFVNVARGENVIETALVRALKEGRIAGAGLDVFETEPLPRDSPLMLLDNVLLTPHWLCSTRQASRKTCESMMRSLLDIAQGKLPSNILNPDVVDRAGFKRKLGRFEKNREALLPPGERKPVVIT
jgi:phosphoglycerate dehydrogenase-like enzyme